MSADIEITKKKGTYQNIFLMKFDFYVVNNYNIKLLSFEYYFIT